jgi:hypothetical protein
MGYQVRLYERFAMDVPARVYNNVGRADVADLVNEWRDNGGFAEVEPDEAQRDFDEQREIDAWSLRASF